MTTAIKASPLTRTASTRRYRRRIIRFVLYGAAIGWTAATLLPLVWMYYSSLKTAPDLVNNRWLPPLQPTFSNYTDAWAGNVPGSQVLPLSTYVFNSILVTVISLTLTLGVGAAAAYALARHDFPGRKVVMAGLLLSLAIPVQALILPIWWVEDKLHLTGTYVGLILPYVAMALPGSVLLLSAYLRSFPTELEDAARIDGLGNLGAFIRVVVPLSKGPLAAIGILLANGFWNEFLFALVMMPQAKMQTLPVGLVTFSGGFYTPTNLILAALAAMTTPVLLLYIAFQRHITSAEFQLVK